MDKKELKSWLRSIITGLVANPSSIEIEEVEDEMGVLFTVRVHKNDEGKVIGKKGSIASAIRTVLRSAGFLNDIRASMMIDVGTDFEPKER